MTQLLPTLHVLSGGETLYLNYHTPQILEETTCQWRLSLSIDVNTLQHVHIMQSRIQK